MRRVAPGFFVLALIALLFVPVGSAARLAQHQTSAGPTQSKAAVSATRTHQVASHVDVSDRFQLDPVTPSDEQDTPQASEPAAIDLPLEQRAEGHDGVPAARGPPVL